MVFKKNIITIVFVITMFIIAIYLYDKYIKIGFDTVEINTSNICNNNKYTTYLFSFPEQNITVNDINGMVVKIYINKKVLKKDFYVKCKNSKRLFIFKSGAILKTMSDSVDVRNTTQKLHGYMGTFTSNPCYFVEQNGGFSVCR